MAKRGQKEKYPTHVDIMPEQMDIIDFIGKEIESVYMPNQSAIKIKQKHKSMQIHLKAQKKNEVKREHLQNLLPTLPEPGWSYHVVSSGNFDFWTYVPHIVSLAGYFDEFYCSTWTMNRDIAVQMVELYDKGKIGNITLFTGKYFKRRETAVYGYILENLLKRGQRYLAFSNHIKLILLRNKDYNITIEGSANLTANPRAEQFIINNNKELYEFHREWMENLYGR